MKRLSAIILSVVMALSVCACGGAKTEETTAEKTKKVDGIELTIDNYETYLNVSLNTDTIDPIDYSTVTGDKKPIGKDVYKGFETNLFVSGKSSNYDYNDVVVSVRIKGVYCPMTFDATKAINSGKTTREEYFLENHIEYDKILTAKTDIIGSGSDNDTIRITDDSYLLVGLTDTNYEVVDVSGTMTK